VPTDWKSWEPQPPGGAGGGGNGGGGGDLDDDESEAGGDTANTNQAIKTLFLTWPDSVKFHKKKEVQSPPINRKL
jgi:hypothetical protein